jgi:hypothetical protein
MSQRRQRAAVMPVDDQSRDVVVFIRNDGLPKKRTDREIRQRHLRSDPFGGVFGCYAGETITGAKGRGLRHQRLQVRENISCAAKRRRTHPLP